MEGKELAQFKDDILRLIVDKEHGADHRWLFYQFKIEGLTTQYLIEILEEIESFRRSGKLISITIGQTHHVQRTPQTQSFLDKKGFVAEREKHIAANKAQWDSATRSTRIAELQEKELNQKIINNKFTLPIAIASIIISLGALGWSILKPSNDVSIEETNTKIESIEKELEELRIEYKEKNKELEDKLYKADMLMSDKGNDEE